jgi:phosphoribosyl 1,2-cyclic phosphate phosphodiesterase
VRLTFLGSSGSEGYPAAFCRCERCVIARRLGGRNIRRRSSLLVDERLLVDLGPDVPAALQDQRLDLARLGFVLITHAHDDHFQPIALKYRHPRYGAGRLAPLTLIGSAPTLARLADVAAALEDTQVSQELAVAGEWLDAEPYRVLPLVARHAPALEPLIYVVSRAGRSVLYATDTGAFPETTWRNLQACVLDAAIWCGTSASSADEASCALARLSWRPICRIARSPITPRSSTVWQAAASPLPMTG